MLADVENPEDPSSASGLEDEKSADDSAAADGAGEEATALLDPRTTDDNDDDVARTTTTQHLDNKHIITVNSLDEYQGETLNDKVDDFIHQHAVVMFTNNKTTSSSQSSIEAKNLLGTQIGCDVHCIDLDVHLQGEEILQYILSAKNDDDDNNSNKDDTTNKNRSTSTLLPLIYIKGKLVGGSEDIKALHATGQLENVYLKGLIHPSAAAATPAGSPPRRLRQLVPIDTDQSTSRAMNPPFWFPNTVNSYVMRGVAFQVFAISVVSVAFPFKPWGYDC
jgi:glutaredoxin